MMGKKKFQSIKRKKRRGLFGKRPQDIAQECVGTDDVTEICDNGPRPVPSGNQVEVVATINKSQEKLLNTSFSEIGESYGSITRSKSLELAKRTESIHSAKGLKIWTQIF